MFNIIALKDRATYKSFHLGESYYNSNSIIHFHAVEIQKNIYEIEASVCGSSIHDVHLVINTETSDISISECTCSYNYGGLCKHIVAVGLKFIETHRKHFHHYEQPMIYEPDYNQTITDGESCIPNIKLLLTGFIMPSSSSKRIENTFSIKIIQDNNNQYNPVFLTREIIQQSTGYYSRLFEILYTKAEHKNTNEYIISHEYIDTVISLLEKIDNVFMENPQQKLIFTDEIYKTEFKIATIKNQTIQIKYNDVKPIVGNYHAYIIKGCKLMKLPSQIPLSFYRKLGQTLFVNKKSTNTFLTKIMPILKEYAYVDDSELNSFQYIITKPGVHLFITQSEFDNSLIMKAYICYSHGITINAMKWGTSSQDDPIVLEENNQVIFIKRELDMEYETYSFLRQMLWEYRTSDEFIFTKNSEIHYFITEFIPNIPNDWFVHYDCPIENLCINKVPLNIDFQITLNEDSSLLEFDLKLYCGKYKIDLSELRKYINNNDKMLNIDGKFFEISNIDQVKKFLAVMDNFHSDSVMPERFKGKLYHAPRLESIVAQTLHCSYRTSEAYQKFLLEIKAGKPVEAAKLDSKFESILRPYQKDGVNWMLFLKKYGFGGILADDMGLGKTLQTLAVLKAANTGNPSLVVCPKTLVYNWYNEIQKFTPELNVLIIEGSALQRKELMKTAENYDIVISSYSVIMQDIAEYKNIHFEYCIIDEAQYIKNPKTKTAKAIKKINSSYRLALTGTPLENNLTELWSIFDFIMPGFLGTITGFQIEYENSITKNEDTDKLNELNSRIKPFLLRRTKKEMLKELPPKIEQTSYCDLTIEQMAIYSKILAQVRSNIFSIVEQKGFERSKIEILSALMKLRQVCNHPGLLDEQYMKKNNVSGKMELFMELVDECIAGGHKLLVFSQFTKMLGILSNYLRSKKINHLYLDGQSKNRQQIIDSFNNEYKYRAFLISLKAGGFGLNLTAADTVIIYDPWWNPMVEMQAIDRAYRIGQENTVNVYKLVTRGTIEEKIIKMQEKKKMLFDNLINENNEFIKKLTWDELKEAFD